MIADQLCKTTVDGTECWLVRARFAALISAHFAVPNRPVLEGVYVPPWIAVIIEVFNKDHVMIEAYKYLRNQRELRDGMIALYLMGTAERDIRELYWKHKNGSAAQGKSRSKPCRTRKA